MDHHREEGGDSGNGSSNESGNTIRDSSSDSSNEDSNLQSIHLTESTLNRLVYVPIKVLDV